MKVQDGGMGCAMEMEEFDQALLEFALDNYDSPGDPGLSRLVNDLTNQAALGYGWERVDDIISDPWKQQAMNLQDSLHGMLRERWSNTEKTEGEGKMAGVVLDPQSALQYGIDAAAIEAALGRRVTVWRETTSAKDGNGAVPAFLQPHLLKSPAKDLDPRVLSGFSIYVDLEEPGEDE